MKGRPSAPPAFGEEAVIAEIRRRTRGRGMHRQLAEELGIDPGNLSRIVSGRRPVPRQLAERLGFRKITVFERVE